MPCEMHRGREGVMEELNKDRPLEKIIILSEIQILQVQSYKSLYKTYELTLAYF